MTAPKHTNRLSSETSPYLLQHAHNPVAWYPWGEEALEKARQEDKPIFLSIGYSACHWCHVMEHESFENEEVAHLMNEHFVNIKVDREERPDLDAIYMNFVQVTTGSGGWPMSVFLTPDCVPFYGGTYFPPQDYYGRPGFKRLLQNIMHLYANRREELLKNQTEIVQTLEKMSQLQESSITLNEELLKNGHYSLRSRFDPIQGGFGQAPKFPPSMSIMFLLRYHLRAPEAPARHMAELTLRKMAEGGIYDQLGGGFHRYSVDNDWLVPHFEKMLYDNALLVRVYLEAYQLTREPLYRRIVEETLAYILREMVHPEGGFYSSQDADSEGQEGKFFVWKLEELESVLGKKEAAFFSHRYGVTQEGNFEGHNVLHIGTDVEPLAKEFGEDPQRVRQILENCQKRLWKEREKRVHPGTDTKVLTAWNGLMLAAFAEAYTVLRQSAFRQAAEKNAHFLLTRLRKKGRMLRSYREGRARLNGYLEDYAYLIEALITLYQATFHREWLNEAVSLTETMLAEFWDKQERSFYFTGRSHEKLLVRHKDYADNATPAANSVATLVLLKLAHLTGNRDYGRHAEQILQHMSQSLQQIPAIFSYQLCALDWHLGPVREFVLVAQEKNQEEFQKAIHARFLPNKVVAGKTAGTESDLPLLQGRDSVANKPTAYICENFSCKQPITNHRELVRELDQLTS